MASSRACPRAPYYRDGNSCQRPYWTAPPCRGTRHATINYHLAARANLAPPRAPCWWADGRPASPAAPLPPQPPPGRFVRIEYLDFQNVAEHREFRLRAYLPDGPADFRFRIAVAAFDARRVRLQDGPDVCYQKLLRAVAAGETPSPDVISIDDLELASYREAPHRCRSTGRTIRRRRRFGPSSRGSRRGRRPRLPVAPLVTNDAEPALEAGQQ